VKTFGSLSKLPRVGLERVRGWAAFNFAAYNLIRIGGIGQWWDPSPTCGKVHPRCKNPGKCSTIEPAERDVEVPPTIDRNYGDSSPRHQCVFHRLEIRRAELADVKRRHGKLKQAVEK
jgi:hypothetical protein